MSDRYLVRDHDRDHDRDRDRGKQTCGSRRCSSTHKQNNVVTRAFARATGARPGAASAARAGPLHTITNTAAYAASPRVRGAEVRARGVGAEPRGGGRRRGPAPLPPLYRLTAARASARGLRPAPPSAPGAGGGAAGATRTGTRLAGADHVVPPYLHGKYKTGLRRSAPD
ncbi:hypothetical protein EVAR_103077_1 [Eumeta japonica]|uniref:Uncharacterized protein n=1 Tax=Eumeta variegata TaxID=151549 RepID=A0A4C1WQ45_EUMVA|nr:hypothetical protein EVAR_103077_1 [Eumeta japonica]